jgi:hypothetical protein
MTDEIDDLIDEVAICGYSATEFGHEDELAVAKAALRIVIDEKDGRISQLEADAQLSERAMRAALALLDTSLETGDGYALPLIELVRVLGLLKSALRI